MKYFVFRLAGPCVASFDSKHKTYQEAQGRRVALGEEGVECLISTDRNLPFETALPLSPVVVRKRGG